MQGMCASVSPWVYDSIHLLDCCGNRLHPSMPIKYCQISCSSDMWQTQVNTLLAITLLSWMRKRRYRLHNLPKVTERARGRAGMGPRVCVPNPTAPSRGQPVGAPFPFADMNARSQGQRHRRMGRAVPQTWCSAR